MKLKMGLAIEIKTVFFKIYLTALKQKIGNRSPVGT
jgi:hypothetical protein